MTDIRETGLALDPKFDANGLVTAVVTDVSDGEVLMVGHMNAGVFFAEPPAAVAKGRKQRAFSPHYRAAGRL
jgi:phosphoribosyl-AMP cyclohydrolase